MKNLLLLLIATVLLLTVGCGGEEKETKISESKSAATIIAEGPLSLPEGTNTEASGHNKEGILPVSYTHLTLPTILLV